MDTVKHIHTGTNTHSKCKHKIKTNLLLSDWIKPETDMQFKIPYSLILFLYKVKFNTYTLYNYVRTDITAITSHSYIDTVYRDNRVISKACKCLLKVIYEGA